VNTKTLFVLFRKFSRRAAFGFLRFVSFAQSDVFVDTTGAERKKALVAILPSYTIYDVIFMPFWFCRFVLSSIYTSTGVIKGSSEFFSGATWPERETAEMFGINFYLKLDARRLMLDYSFGYHPLVKNFPTMGFKEVIYDLRHR
jgi:hypothetical protein